MIAIPRSQQNGIGDFALFEVQRSRTHPMNAPRIILAINGGSSSIRFALFSAEPDPARLIAGKIDRIGSKDASLGITESGGAKPIHRRIAAADHRTAAAVLMDWLEQQPAFAEVTAVGHRVVHGMSHSEPERVTPELLAELRRITPFDPEHLPREIELIEAMQRRFPAVPQIVCFDTAFHHVMPRVATQMAIPRYLEEKGVRRYGFHGLSYTYLLEELARLGDPAAARGRVILAHLGNGASLAAVLGGRCIDTSMGFTPASGLVMSTRSGDLDPGLAAYLATSEAMDSRRFQTMVNHESGMLGIAQTSGDVRDLLAVEAGDARAAEALALFCYQAKKWIGAFTAALGGLETLVFAGGIGENAPLIRSRICGGLEWFGLQLDDVRNSQNAALISAASSQVMVRVIATDEEIMIARLSLRVLGREAKQEH